MVDKQLKLVLEEFDFATKTGGVAVQWQEWLAAKLFDDSAWRDELRRRFAIVDDQSFDHLAEFATEVTAHIAIDDTTGTVADGALWYQEALPAEQPDASVGGGETTTRSPARSPAITSTRSPSAPPVLIARRSTTPPETTKAYD